ncbi:MAG: hypothetical protein WBA13_19370 [Microcoleaceae cyanobacterium]
MGIFEADRTDDFLEVTPDADQLSGFGDSNSLFGVGGHDLVSEHKGNDDLFGNTGSDINIVGDGLGFSVGNSIDFETSLSDTIEESPYIVEFRREGADLLIDISGEQEYSARITGAAHEISDPYATLDSMKFLSDEDFSYLLNYSDNAEAELLANTDNSAPFIDPLGGRAADVDSLTQYLEELETSGADQEQIEYVEDTLLQTQSAEEELAQIEQQIALRTSEEYLASLPEQVILIEEGTFIPAEFQQEIMGVGSEVVTLPEGFFEEFFTPIEFDWF